MMTTNKVAIYVRVSTTNQAEEGYSIEEQKDKLSSYCNIKDWSIYNIYTDGGFSGSNTERPALEKLIKDAKKKKFDTVLVYKLDRLSRSQKDTLYLIEDIFLENNIDFVSLLENFDTSTPFGKAMVGILSVFAQLEREQIKERMQLGKLGRAKSGKSMMWAKVAYGYDYHIGTGEMTVNPWQSITVRSIYDWYLSGKSITKIRDALNENYPKSPAWSYRIVRQILCNPVYCGYNQYKGEVYKGNHEPIVSKKVFDKVQEELKVRQRKAAETGNPRPFQAKYMLSGIAQCGYCHAPLKLILGMIRKDGTRFMKYECYQRIPRKTKGVTVYNNNEKCNSGYYYKEDIEAYVLKEISRLQNDIDYLDEIFDNPETTTIDHDDYQKQIDELSNKLSRLNDLYIDNRITLEELQKRSAEFTTMRAFLEAEIENDPTLKQQERKEDMRNILSAEDIFSMDYERQKVMVRALINKVQVTADDVSIKWKI
ncbi:recombinase family protein [Streptococcus equi subsp. zooepidemicus]|uniref:recombinase family protein n=1 Tax=Streptococcus equi TaxID=1336 RepID=UPI001E49C0CE|nr:recombinase family protein [Streptococcus equi]MCD3414393.1 recombinase family protein [Streptococcus equi subsp. zooepidemicus]HEL0787316.1 recombinase family protein [Streptococcus equi subsp. zooepidemicus]